MRGQNGEPLPDGAGQFVAARPVQNGIGLLNDLFHYSDGSAPPRPVESMRRKSLCVSNLRRMFALCGRLEDG
jgi:hypothetical protein